MKVSIGPFDFDHVSYDTEGDVLYLRAGEAAPAASTYATPEGHAVRLDAEGRVIGMTLVSPKWLIEQEGSLRVTVPTQVEWCPDTAEAIWSGGDAQ
jgi:uncharacterized protein YuzE